MYIKGRVLKLRLECYSGFVVKDLLAHPGGDSVLMFYPTAVRHLQEEHSIESAGHCSL